MDHIDLFGKGNQLFSRDQIAVIIIEPHQYLEMVDLGCRQAHDGLIDRIELQLIDPHAEILHRGKGVVDQIVGLPHQPREGKTVFLTVTEAPDGVQNTPRQIARWNNLCCKISHRRTDIDTHPCRIGITNAFPDPFFKIANRHIGAMQHAKLFSSQSTGRIARDRMGTQKGTDAGHHFSLFDLFHPRA